MDFCPALLHVLDALPEAGKIKQQQAVHPADGAGGGRGAIGPQTGKACLRESRRRGSDSGGALSDGVP